jgi:serine/threonine protein kinase
VHVQPGSRIAHFEVLARVRSTGSGQVYRARDTRLGLDVALKVPPAGFASEADSLERFERGAVATAAPSHPGFLDVHMGTFVTLATNVREKTP